MDMEEFENLRKRFGAVLAVGGYRLVDERYNWQIFGSMNAIWESAHGQVLLVWDAKRETLALLSKPDASSKPQPLAWGTADDAERLLRTAREYAG